MEEYINKSLKARIIHPSPSPATVGFTSTPILRIPDPVLQFVVEVDTSDIQGGGVSVTENRFRWEAPFLCLLLLPAKRNS